MKRFDLKAVRIDIDNEDMARIEKQIDLDLKKATIVKALWNKWRFECDHDKETDG